MRLNDQEFTITDLVTPDPEEYRTVHSDFVQTPSIRFLERLCWLTDSQACVDLYTSGWAIQTWASNVVSCIRDQPIETLIIWGDDSTLSEPFFHRALQEDKQTVFLVQNTHVVGQPIPGFGEYCLHQRVEFLDEVSQDTRDTEHSLWILGHCEQETNLQAFVNSLAGDSYVLMSWSGDPPEDSPENYGDVIYQGKMEYEGKPTHHLLLVHTH